jgi:hypothetical protein
VNPRPLVPSRAADRTYVLSANDPIALFFDATMVGGTALIGGMSMDTSLVGEQVAEYVMIRAEVILEYERTVTELRQQLLHYKRMVSRYIGSGEFHQEYNEPPPIIPLDATSVRIVNSVIQARIPSSASFRDFDEEEL